MLGLSKKKKRGAGKVNNVFTTNILTSRKGITNIKGRVTGDAATGIFGKHWQQTLAMGQHWGAD